MRISLLILFCLFICAVCTEEEDLTNHKRIARQATTKKAATTTKKPATTTKKVATTTKKAATTTKKAATTTKKAAATTKKVAATTVPTVMRATTRQPGATTKKPVIQTNLPPLLGSGSGGATTKSTYPPLLLGSGSGGATTKNTGPITYLPPLLGSGSGGANTPNTPLLGSGQPGIIMNDGMDYDYYGDNNYYSDYNMYYDYGNAQPIQSSAIPIYYSTTRKPSNSKPSYYPWGYYSFQRWFTPRRNNYQSRKPRNYFNFMSRPSYYRYFRRN